MPGLFLEGKKKEVAVKKGIRGFRCMEKVFLMR